MAVRSRAVILPDCGDPFVALFWLHFFKTVWQDEVDMLYYCLNSPVEKEIADLLIREFTAPNITVLYTPHYKQHGEAITDALQEVKEEYVMLIENDAIVFGKGKVDSCFKALESGEYDIVASDRGSASLTLIEAGRKKFHLDRLQHAYRFPHFYPCFFFAKKEWYLQTDQNFGAKSWKRGEYIQELAWEVVPDPGADVVNADTFGWASIQMMARNPRVKYEEQYHAYPHDPELKKNKQHLWDGNAKWMHYGSVSTGTMGALTDTSHVPLGSRTDPTAKPYFIPAFPESSNIEYERRCGYWLMCWETQRTKVLRWGGMYYDAIFKFADEHNLDTKNIQTYASLYRQLIQV